MTGKRTVFSVSAAGMATIANIATTVQGLSLEFGPRLFADRIGGLASDSG
ncbi:MAG: hypothetical protein NVS9B15_23750 [Acidobacteriaceae bacterium]